jgi:adenine/guanine phosphoribosyltransferase-like PRPP-binding protein
LVVARPELGAGRRILVVDDVAATGQQLHAIQRMLLEHGAASVAGLVLARPQLPEASLTVDRLRARLAALGATRETQVPSL